MFNVSFSAFTSLLHFFPLHFHRNLFFTLAFFFFLTYLALFVFLTFLLFVFQFHCLTTKKMYIYIFSKFYTTKVWKMKNLNLFSHHVNIWNCVTGGVFSPWNLRIHTLLLFWCTFFSLFWLLVVSFEFFVCCACEWSLFFGFYFGFSFWRIASL